MNEWCLQVFKVAGKYYYDKTGLFGDVAAGDNWDRIMRLIEAVACAFLNLIVRFYVDDITVLWAAKEGVPQTAKAESDFNRFLSFCKYINLSVHKIFRPSTTPSS